MGYPLYYGEVMVKVLVSTIGYTLPTPTSSPPLLLMIAFMLCVTLSDGSNGGAGTIEYEGICHVVICLYCTNSSRSDHLQNSEENGIFWIYWFVLQTKEFVLITDLIYLCAGRFWLAFPACVFCSLSPHVTTPLWRKQTPQKMTAVIGGRDGI